MKLRRLVDADWPEFTAFATTHFGPSHLTERDFNEHWFRTPREQGWAARVLEGTDGRIAGLMMVIVVPAKFGDREVTLAWISSGAVDDEARARGAGAELYFWVYKTFPLVGAMSGNEYSLPINARLGLDIPGVRMRRFVWIHDDRAARLCREGQRAAVRAWDPRRAGAEPAPAAGAWTDAIPADYDQLWHRVRETIFCTTDRSREYLSWRYVTAPYVRYRFLAARGRGALVALAVARLQETPEGPVCRVVDFVADDAWAAAAWRMVVEASAAEGALFTDFMVIGTRQDAHLRRAGFAPADAETGLDALPHLLSPVQHRQWSGTFHLGGRLAREIADWRRADGVYFTKGDSDRDWPTLYDLQRRAS